MAGTELEHVERKIQTIRGQKVILDADLAELYGVETRRLNEQVKRNVERFPDDFAFQLTEEEKERVVADCDHPCESTVLAPSSVRLHRARSNLMAGCPADSL